MEKIDARSISPSAQEHLRRMAVKAVMEGAKQKEVAKMLGVTRHTICRWMRAYRHQGKEALKAKKKGRPPGGKLLPWQAAQIAKAVMDHHPEQLKLPFFLWTREAVALLIKRRFGVQLSVTSNAGALPRKNRRGGPGNKTPSRCSTGWSKNTPAFAGKLSGRRPRFTGVMKWG
jgi:transposase